MVVDDKYTELAVRTLHKAFALDRDAEEEVTPTLRGRLQPDAADTGATQK